MGFINLGIYGILGTWWVCSFIDSYKMTVKSQ